MHSAFFIPGAQPHPAGESFKKCDRDLHPKPYIFMIRVTRQIKCIIAQAPGSYPTHYLKWTFLMVEITSPKPYIFMIRVNRQIKCPKSWGPGSSPSPTGSFFENITLENISNPSYIHLFFSFLLIYKTRPKDFDLQLGCCISDAFSIFNLFFRYCLIFHSELKKKHFYFFPQNVKQPWT